MFKIFCRRVCVVKCVLVNHLASINVLNFNFNISQKKQFSIYVLNKYYKALVDLPKMSSPKNCQPVGHENVSSTSDTTNVNAELLESDTCTGNQRTNPMSSQELPKPSMSNRALKRKARALRYKEIKKNRKMQNLLQRDGDEAGYKLEEFEETSYYFENGLRKVYPYHFVFATYAKGRWVGRTLRSVLEKEFGFDKPEDVDTAFNDGKIHVNNVQVSVHYVVKDCDYISHQIHRHENPVTDNAIEILADTEDVVVINKPSSIPCHPCGRYRYNSVVFILGKEMGYSNLRNIYRLDRLTSGVLVLGKTMESTKRLEDQVVNREVNKEYVCRVEGEFPSETLTVDEPLRALSNKLRLQVVSSDGKPSQTTFTRLSYNGRSSVVRCIPRTGRTHQIRVHLQYLGYPIINDVFYNSNAWGPNKGKGGVYEVSHDVVCSRILQKHQATQWDGGENPLFHQKLKEMEQRATSTAKEQSGSISNKDDEDTTTTLTKKEKELPGGKTEANVSVAPDKNDVKQDSDYNNCKKDDATDSSSGFVEEEKINDNEELTTCTHPAFDWAKWNVQASCDLCKKTTIDPKPRDLVMFLHALKYRGPGWEYETKLPDWACENWADEDQFMLEPTMKTVRHDTD